MWLQCLILIVCVQSTWSIIQATKVPPQDSEKAVYENVKELLNKFLGQISRILEEKNPKTAEQLLHQLSMQKTPPKETVKVASSAVDNSFITEEKNKLAPVIHETAEKLHETKQANEKKLAPPVLQTAEKQRRRAVINPNRAIAPATPNAQRNTKRAPIKSIDSKFDAILHKSHRSDVTVQISQSSRPFIRGNRGKWQRKPEVRRPPARKSGPPVRISRPTTNFANVPMRRQVIRGVVTHVAFPSSSSHLPNKRQGNSREEALNQAIFEVFRRMNVTSFVLKTGDFSVRALVDRQKTEFLPLEGIDDEEMKTRRRTRKFHEFSDDELEITLTGAMRNNTRSSGPPSKEKKPIVSRRRQNGNLLRGPPNTKQKAGVPVRRSPVPLKNAPKSIRLPTPTNQKAGNPLKRSPAPLKNPPKSIQLLRGSMPTNQKAGKPLERSPTPLKNPPKSTQLLRGSTPTNQHPRFPHQRSPLPAKNVPRPIQHRPVVKQILQQSRTYAAVAHRVPAPKPHFNRALIPEPKTIVTTAPITIHYKPEAQTKSKQYPDLKHEKEHENVQSNATLNRRPQKEEQKRYWAI